jgi:hypothetical protein
MQKGSFDSTGDLDLEESPDYGGGLRNLPNFESASSILVAHSLTWARSKSKGAWA